MAGLDFLAPVPPTVVEELPLAPRPDRLDGARVGLLDNQKANAGRLLACIGEALVGRSDGVELTVETKVATSAAPDVVMDHLRRCDAVVLAIAD